MYQRIPRSFHEHISRICVCTDRKFACVREYVRVAMANKRIASQGMSILNREGSTENNEVRYDEREVAF